MHVFAPYILYLLLSGREDIGRVYFVMQTKDVLWLLLFCEIFEFIKASLCGKMRYKVYNTRIQYFSITHLLF